MEPRNFWLVRDSQHPRGDVIYARHGRLRISVCDPDDAGWSPFTRGLRFYGRSGEKLLAFEIDDDRSDAAWEITEAIQWYAAYLEIPSVMLILTDDAVEINRVIEQ